MNSIAKIARVLNKSVYTLTKKIRDSCLANNVNVFFLLGTTEIYPSVNNNVLINVVFTNLYFNNCQLFALCQQHCTKCLPDVCEFSV